jgi:DNA-binding NarL/FixJ family response regulator
MPTRGGGDRITILIVDPHAVTRDALATLLGAESQFDVIAAVSDLEEALGVVCLRAPDVTLVDLAALGDRRAAGLGALRSTRPATALLVIGVVEDPVVDRDVARMGASGRILKDAPRSELLGAVRAAGRRRHHLRLVPREP